MTQFLYGHQHVGGGVRVKLWTRGVPVGLMIPTKGAVIPAADGIAIGCGMMAARTSLMAQDLPDNLAGIRARNRAGGAA